MNQVMNPGVDYNLTVSKNENGMTVLVMPRMNGLKDDAKHHLTPLTLRGTPEEIDNGFFAAVSQPLQRAAGLLTGMAEFEKQAELAAANSKAAKEQKDKESKEAREKREKYDKHIKKAEEQEAAKEYAEAVTSLKQASLYATPQALKSVNEKIAALRSKSNEGTLFGASEAEPEQQRQTPPVPQPASQTQSQQNFNAPASPQPQMRQQPSLSDNQAVQQGIQFRQEVQQPQAYPASGQAPVQGQPENGQIQPDRQWQQQTAVDPFENIPSNANGGSYDAIPRNAAPDGYPQQQNPAKAGLFANGYSEQADPGYKFAKNHPPMVSEPGYGNGTAYNGPTCREDEYDGYVDFPGRSENYMLNA